MQASEQFHFYVILPDNPDRMGQAKLVHALKLRILQPPKNYFLEAVDVCMFLRSVI
jgi:hypothetical protein